MNESEIAKSSIAEIVQRIIPLFDYCPSVEQFQDTVQNFESNIEDLEARVESIQQEIELLIAEQ